VQKEYFAYNCPHCHAETNAALVATALPDAVLNTETARRNGRRQTPHAGPGRPTVVRCPGCDQQMPTADLREHRAACVRDRLLALWKKSFRVWLSPKDPDPHPDFSIQAVDDEAVHFNKLSTPQRPIAIELRKIAEITVDDANQLVNIRLLGRLAWDTVSTLWSFEPSRIGRPSGDRQ
jgi:hypothetical protein